MNRYVWYLGNDQRCTRTASYRVMYVELGSLKAIGSSRSFLSWFSLSTVFASSYLELVNASQYRRQQGTANTSLSLG